MARILIFQGSGGQFFPLQNCLGDSHDIYRACNIPDAMKILRDDSICLIICSVYDGSTDAFMFLSATKRDLSLNEIPVLFFSRERTICATFLDPVIKHAALVCGANEYLSMDSFCLAPAYIETCVACPFYGKLCDYAGLTRAIEDMLSQSPYGYRHARPDNPIGTHPNTVQP